MDQIPRGRIPILTSRRAQMAKEMHLHFRNKHSKMALSCYKTRCSEEELPQLKNLGISFSTYYLLQIYKLTATTRELQPRGWWNLRHSLVSVLTFKFSLIRISYSVVASSSPWWWRRRRTSTGGWRWWGSLARWRWGWRRRAL